LRCRAGYGWIAERELTEGLGFLLNANDLPVVSLDLAYAPRGLEISLTRLADMSGKDAGYGARNGSAASLAETVDILSRMIRGKKLVLVDDVLFSGAMFARIISLFRERGLCVPRVYAGVAVGEGIRRMQSMDCEVRAVRSYEDVVDEVCERDFMPGSPLSGRTVKGLQNTGMPYLLPFGNPAEWASIPEVHARSFSARFLRLSAGIYRSTGMTLDKLPRRIYGLDQSADAPVGEALEELVEFLKPPVKR